MAQSFSLKKVFYSCFGQPKWLQFQSKIYVFGIVIAFVVVVWKNYFIKSIFGWDWFNIYIYLVKTMVEIEIEQKII
jgi:hypothetical protein